MTTTRAKTIKNKQTEVRDLNKIDEAEESTVSVIPNRIDSIIQDAELQLESIRSQIPDEMQTSSSTPAYIIELQQQLAAYKATIDSVRQLQLNSTINRTSSGSNHDIESTSFDQSNEDENQDEDEEDRRIDSKNRRTSSTRSSSRRSVQNMRRNPTINQSSNRSNINSTRSNPNTSNSNGNGGGDGGDDGGDDGDDNPGEFDEPVQPPRKKKRSLYTTINDDNFRIDNILDRSIQNILEIPSTDLLLSTKDLHEIYSSNIKIELPKLISTGERMENFIEYSTSMEISLRSEDLWKYTQEPLSKIY
jgi:hypothetical protein